MSLAPTSVSLAAPAGDRSKARRGAKAARTLLVGTSMSVAQLHHSLQLAQPRPRIIGCLLPASSQPDRRDAVPVLGSFENIEAVVRRRRIDMVLVSLPVAMRHAAREVSDRLGRLEVTWRCIPTLADQLAGRVSETTPRADGRLAVDTAQLIDRPARPLDEPSIRRCVARRRVLITGAGGSIGSELARIIARFRPAGLVLLERSENALFEIDRELARLHPGLERRAVLHDITSAQATRDCIAEHAPDVIFHAAAHKHVPMMEDHPAAAVENNFFGTRAVADAADAAGVERFVMISSDKAVNPSSVMGATKRLAELYIQHLNQRSGTIFSMVRFGNVLGSACSVLPIWADQLARGGPITVTHPQMTRYFMTIPEAAALVLQAGALSGTDTDESGGRGGEVFLLDMGEPVRIVELARRFIAAHGYEPDVDVEIAYTGIRPGEKLFEELAYDSEDMIPTDHAAVRIWRTARPDAARMGQIVATFERLRNAGGDPSHPWRGVARETMLTALRAAVPEMTSAAAG